jgi:hypothetical protein
MKRREFIGVGWRGNSMAALRAAQQPTVPVIGFLISGSADFRIGRSGQHSTERDIEERRKEIGPDLDQSLPSCRYRSPEGGCRNLGTPASGLPGDGAERAARAEKPGRKKCGGGCAWIRAELLSTLASVDASASAPTDGSAHIVHPLCDCAIGVTHCLGHSVGNRIGGIACR